MSSYANGPKTVVVDAVLFDMDGTLIDSTPAALKAWETFCTDYSLGDYVAVANAARGRRLHDTLKEYGRIDDQVKLQSEIDRFETEVIEGGLITLPGVSNRTAFIPNHFRLDYRNVRNEQIHSSCSQAMWCPSPTSWICHGVGMHAWQTRSCSLPRGGPDVRCRSNQMSCY